MWTAIIYCVRYTAEYANLLSKYKHPHDRWSKGNTVCNAIRYFAKRTPRPLLRRSGAQARRQDLAAGEAKNQDGPKNRRGGHIFKMLYWMYAATRAQNVEWWGTYFKWVAGHHCPPLAMDLTGHPRGGMMRSTWPGHTKR